jgi:DNA-binding response OmpR family regulator
VHAAARARHRHRHGRARRFEPAPHTLEQRVQVAELRRRFAFGSVAQPLGIAAALAFVQARLGRRAFDLLAVLAVEPERTLPRDELLDRVWPGLVVEPNNLEVQVWALPRVIGRDAIATIPGRG